MKETLTLSERFTFLVFDYETAFCKKMKLDKSNGEWVHFGKLYFNADYYFSFSDMVDIVDKKIPAKIVVQWYDYCIETGKPISLLPYIKGARHSNPKVYLSAPITGKPIEVWHKQFLDAELKARKSGYDVVNPAYEGVKLLGFDADWINYMTYDIQLLQKADYIWFFSGEPDSNGVAIERAIADNFGIKTIEL